MEKRMNKAHTDGKDHHVQVLITLIREFATNKERERERKGEKRDEKIRKEKGRE
jgi:hypothetical protein